ncbi:SGNH/GDSL hydrolase family protein [Demequina mangrovi]|uniref:SGNH/GDSL hydrolase family protein n=1 Tax=Demequina mangrovi TaxID=1043493 RepID=UPI000A6CDD1C|nr:SGNH/GDSL hydrolase family protein [Demequina mangrovi]
MRAALLALAMTMAACSPGGGGGSPTAGAEVLEVVAVGDSLMFGDSTSFTAEGLGQGSFLWWALGDEARLAGGTAVPGATSVEQRDRVRAAEPVPDADVLVLALGTNDLAVGLPFARTSEALIEIAALVDAPRTLLLTVPPIDLGGPVATAPLNARLAALAEAQGWELVDAPAAVRDGDGWADGMTPDGVHYTSDGARVVGEALGAALSAA